MASQLSLPDLTTPFHLPTAASTSHPMPRLALGTFKVTGPTCRDAIVAALDAGIRHLDTAAIYKNHVEVAAALRLAGLPRDDVFLTTKISPYDMGSDLTPRAIQNALAELQTNYVDLLLLHWPGVARKKHTDPVHRARRREAWVALEAAVREGHARAIGVSNFTSAHLEEVCGYATVPVAVNQFECHPRWPQRELIDTCRRLGVVPQAYSPLGTGELLHHPRVRDLAGREKRKGGENQEGDHEKDQGLGTAASLRSDPPVGGSRRPEVRDDGGRGPASGIHGTAAQVLLRWILDQDMAVVVKSTQPDRIREWTPAALASLTSPPSTSLATLADDPHKYCWDPSTVL